MDLNLTGRRVLVTGASKGIGKACAEALAAEGCEVLIAARNPAPGPNAKAIDLSQRGAPETLAAWAGEIDVLINNAGAIPGGDLLKVDEQTWRRAWDLKVFGYINLGRQVYAAMKRRRRGVILNIIGSAGEKHFYGVELLDLDVSLWGIDFPEPSESEMAVGRVLLECVRCHSQELVYLDEFEVEVLETNNSLSRPCRRCTDTSVWKKSTPREGAELPPAPSRPGVRERRTRNDRKYVRLDLRVDVCIRHPQLGEEVATTVNVSRGGFRFRSTRGYGEGWVIEASLPYSKGGANIFTPARVVYVGEASGDKAYVYGVMYLPRMQAEITV